VVCVCVCVCVCVDECVGLHGAHGLWDYVNGEKRRHSRIMKK